MYRPIIRINELEKFLIRFRVIETALDSVILFLSLFIILSYAGIDRTVMLLLPTVLFFFIVLRYRSGFRMIRLIETRYPSLRERLGALYDSRDEKNAVVEHLAASVDTEMERVKYSSFISIGRIGLRAAVIMILVTFVLSFALFNTAGFMPPGRTGSMKLPENAERPSSQDISGEASAVKIGNESQGMVLYRGSGYETNVAGEGKQVSGQSDPFPPESSSSGTYAEDVPAVYQTIVKNYFTNLSLQD